MEELIDLIATDSSSSDISDKIKEVLYAKSAEKIEGIRPEISNLLFNNEEEMEEEV